MLTGFLIFIWVGIEDRSSVGPVLVGGMIALSLSTNIGQRLAKIQNVRSIGRPGHYVLTGLVAGALAMPLAALAMLVIVSLHGHVPPDFTAAQVLDVLAHTPVWTMAGSLISLGLLWRSGSKPTRAVMTLHRDPQCFRMSWK
jgi:hypothetical protein